ncbi:MAG: DNA gyrase subunit A [Acidobacteria bacterium]|nr:DNA gyrase subunit A [Acidobacteriota bacterium]MYA46315.1 DNA gyrase subunit A [Acidobacteriota bacterium]MYI38019.1 DNA gyrase subunit A [Acidobacteriota bacterium]
MSRARYQRVEHIETEMTQSYMDYAMSVIIGRALPDVRDGLKPVQRRVVYAMFREGLLPSRSYSKCAGIVGEVLKKYHPHGDASVYDTLVRLAQGFNQRHPLIDGKGNFGSVDGDPPAAYRYTEARLTQFAIAMMEDIDRATVNFQPNFDGKTVEPEVLPTVVPGLLVNGSDGIAVGMATKIPPHNLREVTAALVHLIEHPEASDEHLNAELLELVPGPDFPTGGRIHGRRGIVGAYYEGRGIIQVRAVADFETARDGRDRIVVTEIPYQVNKARLIEKIAELVKDKRLSGISDLRDESDRRGMRVVIELKRGEEPQIVLNNLYRHTAMQSSFGMNLLAISQNRPRLFSLLGMLREFLQFRRQVVRRRTRFELDRAEQRMHILEGLAAAVDRLDEVIEWIRRSKDPASARARLMRELQPRRFGTDRELLARAGNGRAAPDQEGLSEAQAQAILDLRLQRLTQMERERIEAEMAELGEKIHDLRDLLQSPERVDGIIRDEAQAAARKHGNERRTEIVEDAGDLSIEELIPVEDIVISVTQAGYIKRTPLTDYRAQSRGGTGHSGAGIRAGDAIHDVLIGNTHSRFLFLTDEGIAYRLKGYEIPEAGKAGRGRAIVNLLSLPKERQVVAIVPLPEDDEASESLHLFTASRCGQVKRTALSQYRNVRAVGLRAVRIPEGDALLAATLTSGESHVVLTTRNGKAIRFRESDVRSMGRDTAGVRGIRLRGDDEVVSLVTVEDEPDGGTSLLTVTEHGYGKMSSLDHYPLKGRSGLGVLNIKASERNGHTVATVAVRSGEEVIAITAAGKAVRIPVEDFRDLKRITKGVRAIRVGEGDEVVAITRIPPAPPEEDAADAPDEEAVSSDGSPVAGPEEPTDT